MSIRALGAALALAGAAFAAPAAVGSSEAEPKLAPKALYKALAKIPRGPTTLPSGYQSPTIGPVPVSPTAKRHHAVGAVAIGMTKRGTAGARILFIVFPNRAAALADWREATPRLPGTHVEPPRYLPKPSTMVHARASTQTPSGRVVSFGTTILAFVTENVIVEVDTSSSNGRGGDDAGAVALVQFAGGHLAAAAASLAPRKPFLPVA